MMKATTWARAGGHCEERAGSPTSGFPHDSGASGTFYFHYIALEAEAAGLPVDRRKQPTLETIPSVSATQVIGRNGCSPVDAIHKLYQVSKRRERQDGNILVTAYAVERPDGNGPSC